MTWGRPPRYTPSKKEKTSAFSAQRPLDSKAEMPKKAKRPKPPKRP